MRKRIAWVLGAGLVVASTGCKKAGTSPAVERGPAPVARAADEKPVASIYPATCDGLADRAKADVRDKLPPEAPEDLPDRLREMLFSLCSGDAWSQQVIDCGVTEEDPDVCRPKLTSDQRAHLDAERTRLAQEMLAEMASSDDGAGVRASTGIPECDDFLLAIEQLAACDKLDASTREAFVQMADSFASIEALPDDQKATMAAQCTQGLGGVAQTATAYGC